MDEGHVSTMIGVMNMRGPVIDTPHLDNDRRSQIIEAEMILVEVRKSEWFEFIHGRLKIGGIPVNIQGRGVDLQIIIGRREVLKEKGKNIKIITKNSIELQKSFVTKIRNVNGFILTVSQTGQTPLSRDRKKV